MNDPASKIYKNLKDVFLEKGLINREKYDEINLRQLKTGETEEEVIKALRIIPDEEFVRSKALFLRVPYVDLETIGFSPEALTLVPESVAQKYKIVPYSLDPKDKVLSIAMVNPLDLETVQFLEKKTGLRVKVAISTEKQILGFINEKRFKWFS
jgi:type IV pilus assembly protein PilB